MLYVIPDIYYDIYYMKYYIQYTYICAYIYIIFLDRLVILFEMLLNPTFKRTTDFANIPRTTASTSKFIYYERFQIIRNWVFI